MPWIIHTFCDFLWLGSNLFAQIIQDALQWRHAGCDGVSNHQPHDCLLNRLYRQDQRKYQSSASLAFERGNHRWAVNSPHKWPVTRKMFPFDDVIMWLSWHRVEFTIAAVLMEEPRTMRVQIPHASRRNAWYDYKNTHAYRMSYTTHSIHCVDNAWLLDSLKGHLNTLVAFKTGWQASLPSPPDGSHPIIWNLIDMYIYWIIK